MVLSVDERGFRVAVVADELINTRTGGLDALAILNEVDWGAIQLPPRWYPDRVAGQLLEQVAEQVEEFARHGYDVVVVGGRDGLAEALEAAGTPYPESVNPESADELRAFLQARTPPAVAQR